MRLEGKTALVTGGASGFGAGIARKFCAEGARVMIADVNAEAVEAMAGVLGASFVLADVGMDPSVGHMAMAALGEFGHLDILVNNAGVTHLPAALEDISEEDFDRVLRVNAKSVYLTARHLVPGMKAAGRGAILNIASTAGLSPRPRLNWYNASKGWMIRRAVWGGRTALARWRRDATAIWSQSGAIHSRRSRCSRMLRS
jgi:3-oxoacyl-[acyl-carrier protein] reductase